MPVILRLLLISFAWVVLQIGSGFITNKLPRAPFARESFLFRTRRWERRRRDLRANIQDTQLEGVVARSRRNVQGRVREAGSRRAIIRPARALHRGDPTRRVHALARRPALVHVLRLEPCEHRALDADHRFPRQRPVHHGPASSATAHAASCRRRGREEAAYTMSA